MLFRTALWFSMVLMLIPIKNDRLNEHSKSTSRIEVYEIIGSFVRFGQKMCGEHQLPCEETQELAAELVVSVFDFTAATPEIAENIAQFILTDQKQETGE